VSYPRDVRFVLSLISVFASACMGVSNISRARAHELVASGAQLVDVRTPTEFADRHAEPAINVPLGDLDRRMNELDREKPVIVYCHSGARAGIAARKLERAGFRHVYSLGALQHWDYEPSGIRQSFE
jgi:phage shock protein E